MNSSTFNMRKCLAQLTILSLSTLSLSMYFGRELPNGIDLITLQVGLVGTITFLSLSQMSLVPGGQVTDQSKAFARNAVEKRLERYIPPTHIGRTRKRSAKYSAMAR